MWDTHLTLLLDFALREVGKGVCSMADTIRYLLSINMIDGVQRPCGSSFYIDAAKAQLYLDAADDTERGNTDVGLLITDYVAMTDAVLVSTNVALEASPATPPGAVADTVLRGNKLSFQYSAGGIKRDFQIPARKTAAFTQSADSLKVAITTPSAMSTFVAKYAQVVVNAYNVPAAIQAAKIVD